MWGRTDNGGQTPEVGDYVAYNWSGQIAAGFILSVSKDGMRFRIHQVLPKRQEGHISRINGGPQCMLVLDKHEAED